MIYTRIDMINEVLATQGFLKLSAADMNHPEYNAALSQLESVSKMIQAPGRWFNKFTADLVPNVDDSAIYLPSNLVSCDPVSTGADNSIVVRGNKLFNIRTRSYEFSGSVRCHLVEYLPLEDLPPSAQIYVLARARQKYHSDKDGDPDKQRNLMQEAAEALVMFIAEDLKHKDLNVLNSNASNYFRTFGSTGVGTNRLMVTYPNGN